jgi:hypothetical protein
MDAKKLDKKMIKNWIDGDTFLVKINNVSEEYQEYKDKYLALIYKNDYEKNICKGKKAFYVKYINSYEKPQSIEEIKTYPSIQMGLATPYESRRLASNFKQVLKFDEYQYAYIYYCEIEMKNSDIKENFEYIGNIQNIRNEFEFPVDRSYCGQMYCFFKDFQNRALWMYNLHNKKQCIVFTEEGNKEHLIYQYGAEKTINEVMDIAKNNPELLKEMYDGDDDDVEDSLTYVGEGLDEVYKED